MTNGEKVRSLTDEELATFLEYWTLKESLHAWRGFWGVFLKNEMSDELWNTWLKGESEDD